MNWYDLKMWLSVETGLNMDALHVYAGMLCHIAAALAMRRSLASPLPWLVALVAILANEYHDYRFELRPDWEAQRDECIRDIWNTMLMPTAIMLLARFVPSLFRPRPSKGGGSATDPG